MTEGGALPEKLQKVKVAPINDNVCDAALGAGRIKDVMICAGLLELSYIVIPTSDIVRPKRRRTRFLSRRQWRSSRNQR